MKPLLALAASALALAAPAAAQDLVIVNATLATGDGGEPITLVRGGADAMLIAFQVFLASNFMVGLPVAAAGLVYIAILGWRLIPGDRLRRGAAAELMEVSAYVTELTVQAGSALNDVRVCQKSPGHVEKKFLFFCVWRRGLEGYGAAACTQVDQQPHCRVQMHLLPRVRYVTPGLRNRNRQSPRRKIFKSRRKPLPVPA